VLLLQRRAAQRRRRAALVPRLHLAAAFVIVRFILGELLARGPAPVSVRKQREERYRGEDPRTDQADSGTMHRGVRVQNAVNAANDASDENGRTWKCGAEHRSVAVGVVLSCLSARLCYEAGELLLLLLFHA